jgi:ActR/RegA family two-component response regulator
MPVMGGVEVVKAAEHLRPDVDVAVITGFGTIETAVETGEVAPSVTVTEAAGVTV